MKRKVVLVLIIFVLCTITACFVGCNKEHGPLVDYVSQLTLDMGSTSLKQVVTVKNFVDGDTTHFYDNKKVDSSGIVKARYLAINTPESTGSIEEWGKSASNFTKEKLQNAVSIIIESDNSTWNTDTNGRYLVWVWYKPSEGAEYRNLNLEILQNGLAVASNTAQNRYGDICIKALRQAEEHKLKVFSGEPDPSMYHGDIQEITLRELRCNIDSYNGVKVAVEGVIALDSNGSIYLEELDEESGVYFGISVYYGTAKLTGSGLRIISTGNRVRLVATVSYYETGGKWQLQGIKYDPYNRDDPENMKKISEGHQGAYPLVEPATFVGKVNIITKDDDSIEMDYAQAVLDSTISMNGLKVVDVYTTTSEESSSKGAMTLTCRADDGTMIDVRTTVFRDEKGNLITEDAYLNKTINIRGVVDYFDGDYQIKVFAPANIAIVE